MDDHQLRHITSGQGKASDGVKRDDGFDITVASEVIACFCLANDLADLKQRLGDMLVAYTYDDKPVYARNIDVQGAMTALLKEAILPNLVQTLAGIPALVHGGPFANIAHGCNSIIATKTALHLADIVVAEAGFGSGEILRYQVSAWQSYAKRGGGCDRACIKIQCRCCQR